MKWVFGRASDEESLRLMTAFLQISDADRRKSVVELAELLQRISPKTIKARAPLSQDNEEAAH